MRNKATAIILYGVCLIAQPAFEVASIKPHDIFKPDGRKLGLSLSGNKVSLICMPLVSLITEAYGVERYQVAGGPKWTSDSVGGVYDVTAKTEGEGVPSKEQVREMLQTLLADRFQIQLHREMKELPVYELVVGKRGPKLKESPAESISSNRQTSSKQAIQMIAVHETLAHLANMIAIYAGRPVIDKTGLTKTYDFALDWIQEGPHDNARPDASDPAGPSIFTALEEQLGLKLEPQKKPTEMLIIDRAERPSEN
jgi:uncharacterized protein (TIGR03435 family)